VTLGIDAFGHVRVLVYAYGKIDTIRIICAQGRSERAQTVRVLNHEILL
jgi:hypothetical protein